MNSSNYDDSNTSRRDGHGHAPRGLASSLAGLDQGTQSSNTVTQYPLLTFQMILPAFCGRVLIACT